jgi:hypothetical protein
METHVNKNTRKTKTRWGNDVRNDLKTMGIHNWRNCIKDRCKWKEVVEKAKTFNE